MNSADGIPDWARAQCEICQRDLNTRALGVYQYTEGWVMARSGGGGHGVSLPKRHNRWAHGHCIEHLAKREQGALF